MYILLGMPMPPDHDASAKQVQKSCASSLTMSILQSAEREKYSIQYFG